jgi:hypothetical protein
LTVPTATPTQYLDKYHSERYKKNSVTNHYVIESGKFVLPVAIDEADLEAGESPVCIITAHAPFRHRTVSFDNEKNGGPPMIPSPEDAGAHVFLEGSILFHPPRMNATLDSFSWKVVGNYAFIENVKHDLDDGFVLGTQVVPSYAQEQLKTLYSGNLQGQTGAVASAGPDVTVGVAEAAQMDVTNSTYSYLSTGWFPPQMLNEAVLSGSALTLLG